MKVLQLCHKPPCPPVDGGCLAMYNLSRGLLDNGVDLRIMTIHTHKHDFRENEIPAEFLKSTNIDSVFVDTKLNFIDAFSNLITDDSYNISRFFSPDFDIRLSRILKKEKFDIIHLESLFMTPYLGTIRRHSKAKVVLRSHNLEHIIWERMAVSSRNRIKRAYIKHLAKQLKKYEQNTLNEVNGIAAITKHDANMYRKYGFEGALMDLPFGLFLEEYQYANPGEHFPGIFHLGSMDWKPNEEGIQWFLENVWPKVLKAIPKAQFNLAGRNMPEWLLETELDGVQLDGEVPSARGYMSQFNIMVVPLLSAGGMRVKIIEGMALGKAIVSTRIGAEGVDGEHGSHLMIADKADEMAAHLIELANDAQKTQELGKNARQLIEERYDHKVLGGHLISFYKSLTEA